MCVCVQAGHLLASSCSDATVAIWDLRKMAGRGRVQALQVDKGQGRVQDLQVEKGQGRVQAPQVEKGQGQGRVQTLQVE